MLTRKDAVYPDDSIDDGRSSDFELIEPFIKCFSFNPGLNKPSIGSGLKN